MEQEDPLVSDPALDAEQATVTAIGIIVRANVDSNFRIVRRQVKVDGVWYNVEVSRP